MTLLGEFSEVGSLHRLGVEASILSILLSSLISLYEKVSFLDRHQQDVLLYELTPPTNQR